MFGWPCLNVSGSKGSRFEISMRPRRTKGKVSAKAEMATQKALSLVAANRGTECLR